MSDHWDNDEFCDYFDQHEEYIYKNNSREMLSYTLLYTGVQTDKAILFGHILHDSEFWLPKSQIVYSDEELETGKQCTVVIPMWLAEKKD